MSADPREISSRAAAEYRELRSDEIELKILSGFSRRQTVTRCWRKIDGEWTVKDVRFIDDWSPAEYEKVVSCLKNTAETGGLVLAAFRGETLKGFVSVEPELFGRRAEYLDLSSIHVSEESRGRGIGRELFLRAESWAKAHGARKLYISAHSSVESQAFYRAMGCVEAEEYSASHVEAEPFDCQLECSLEG